VGALLAARCVPLYTVGAEQELEAGMRRFVPVALVLVLVLSACEPAGQRPGLDVSGEDAAQEWVAEVSDEVLYDAAGEAGDEVQPVDTIDEIDTSEVADEPCPQDYFGADGTPCLKEGQVCGGHCTDPCQFCNTLTCMNGHWVWMEAFPDPTCPPQGQCRTSGDCQQEPGQYCVPPGSPQACGICFSGPDECQLDQDCGAGQVCELRDDLCTCQPYKWCVPACSLDVDCPAGKACQAGHCGPINCAQDVDCPPFFMCPAAHVGGQPGDQPAVPVAPWCQRQACATPYECGAGQCVEGQCYETWGTCELPVS
jgi:hypothetical protein